MSVGCAGCVASMWSGAATSSNMGSNIHLCHLRCLLLSIRLSSCIGAVPSAAPLLRGVEAPPREEQKDLFEAMGSLDFSACVQEEFAKWADNLDIQSPARQLPGASGLAALKSVPRRRLKAGSRAAQSALSMRLSVPRQKERMLV